MTEDFTGRDTGRLYFFTYPISNHKAFVLVKTSLVKGRGTALGAVEGFKTHLLGSGQKSLLLLPAILNGLSIIALSLLSLGIGQISSLSAPNTSGTKKERTKKHKRTKWIVNTALSLHRTRLRAQSPLFTLRHKCVSKRGCLYEKITGFDFNITAGLCRRSHHPCVFGVPVL